MWVATFSVTAVRVGPAKGRSRQDSLDFPTRTEAAAARRCSRAEWGPSPEWPSKPALTSFDYHVSVRRRTALTKGGTDPYPLRHPGNHVSIFTCMDV